ncbi:hypothetical protein FGU71_03595 [Erythrobacter insulae]|uniref:Uncharacterized protein n=1 Tax=Erythrobacter insulae TaxID=2584124 RepID=A0A547PA60_9SPHN|nr:hypothetical protein [Erythrobacter insulae]TRD11023.1 hypothetical protein FGU71_03595 [Erythrobacter insulae]
MKEFEPDCAAQQISLLEAYDAIGEFISLNYGSLVGSSEGLSNLYNDTHRGLIPGGFPSDESTWDVWLQACQRVREKGQAP